MSESIKIQSIESEDTIVANRYDFVGFVSCRNGNPNGDPDNGNAPRTDTSNNHGVLSDVSIKGHTRRAVKQVFGEPIMIDKDNRSIKDAVEKLQVPKGGDVASALCKHYWDVRAFGGVFGKAGNSVTGPVQVSNAMTVHEVAVHEIAINRCIQNEVKENKNGDEEVNSQFGDKPYLTYGLYQFTGSICPFQAQRTGFTDADREKLFKAMNMSYSLWTTAQKGETEMAKIVVFKHASALGNAKVSRLRQCITVKLKDGVTVPTDYSDYEITVDESKLPEGVTVEVIE